MRANEGTLSSGIRSEHFTPGASGSHRGREGERQFLFTSNMWHDDVKRATEEEEEEEEEEALQQRVFLANKIHSGKSGRYHAWKRGGLFITCTGWHNRL